jgi:divalent metal cation (Fe/Co/Zn/Cd) transporter
LAVIYFTDLFFIDALVGFIIALYIMYSSVELIKKGFLMLLDIALEDEEVEKIINCIKQEKMVNDYHYLKTRRS